MDEVRYCEKCGYVGHVLFNKKCKNCKIKMKILPEEIKQKYNIFNEDWSKLYSELHMLNTIDGAKRRVEELLSRTNNFIMNEVVNNSLFSLEDYKKQVEKDKQGYYETVEYHNKQIGERQAKNLAQIQKENDKQNCIPKCPTCGSTNVVKISLAQKAVGGAMVGLYSSDIRNTMHCKNCGAKW